MSLIDSKSMFAKALASDYAVGAFNVSNLEFVQGAVAAAKTENAPLILQVTPSTVNYAGGAYMVKLAEAASESAGFDLVLHLDHGEDFEMCKMCIDFGFSSVMIDGSKLPFGENVALVKKVVEYAHANGVPVEAELGKLAGVEDGVSVDARSAAFTDPAEAAEFVALTGVDSLAVAIGTSHGAYKFKGEPYLDFDRLQKIHAMVPDTPLVLHGASTVPQAFVEKCNMYGGSIHGGRGVDEYMIRDAAKHGICKVNISTDLKLAMMAELREFLAENPSEFDPRKYLSPGKNAVQNIVRHIIRDVLGASGRR